MNNSFGKRLGRVWSQYSYIFVLGMAFVIITGQIDLSVGSSLVLCTGVTIVVFNMTDSIVLMILAALVTGALCGLINGLLVGLGKMPPFVVTLGTMLIYRSLTLSVVRKIDPAISGSSSSQFAMISQCHLGKDFRVCPHRRAGRHCFYSSGMQNR